MIQQTFTKGKLYCFPFLVLLFLLTNSSVYGQSKEIGGGIASFNYTGDLIRTYDITNQTLGAHFFYVKNYERGWSGKIALAGGMIKGSDKRPIDPMAEVRSAGFKDFITEVSAQMNYDFLDYRSEKALVKFTPYLTVGVGFLLLNRADKNAEYSDVQLMIPFGGGIKYSINPLWSVNFEFSARKLFYDYIDNISEQEVTDKRNSDFQFGNWEDNDWYYFAGLSVSYTFWNINCPIPLAK
ncbi:outer membrane beta-barrel protein [Marivirga sp. S37H4]|uniref:Outer membrane beta-barrel protein n=1 Tax=Marivirga aurantiaca TaxID=2802615 RepID=A0A934X278_9BACT|nr:DUF6089 family protein [Marivirga aurantiaca]MBK6267030.1 outer membrane beta-barrel protein [Marivirga aurantiaca]